MVMDIWFASIKIHQCRIESVCMNSMETDSILDPDYSEFIEPLNTGTDRSKNDWNRARNSEFINCCISQDSVSYCTVIALIIENAPNLRTPILGEFPNLHCENAPRVTQ